jgi:putative Mn2+ efflux pump MntP
MQANYLGLAAAVAAFLGIWIGHVAVRKIEFNSPNIWLPTVVFASSGIVLEYTSILIENRVAAAILGILGITLLWDALEMTRQQRRVRKGHAPANPRNLRHARILAEYPSATTLDLLKREPLGRPVSHEEAIELIRHKP